MLFQSSLIYLSLSIAHIVYGWDDIILQPPSTKNGPTSVLFFAQGADIETSQYVDILGQLQQAVDFPLWVGIPQCPDNIAAIPNAISNGIDRINEKMISEGMNANYFFYGGHSLGGAMMPDYVNSTVSTTATGMVLMGSFLTRKYKTGATAEGRPQVSYPVPTLTIGGELDGLCRMTRIAENIYTQITFSEDPETAAVYMPVTMIEGMNHMQFASGEPPTFVKDNDLQAEISEGEAHSRVVGDAAAFFNSLIYPDNIDYVNTVRSRVQDSTEFTQPVIDALLMEGYQQFLPPCYCETEDEYGGLQYGTCVSTPSCTGGVQWTGEHSQVVMAGLDEVDVEGLSVVATDSIHLVTEEDPSCHLPHIHGGENREDSSNPGDGNTPPICPTPVGCELNITTVTQHNYDNSGEVDIWRLHFSVPWIDTGYLPIAARELKTKLKSRQAIWEAAGVLNASFTETDKPAAAGGTGDRCAEINQASIDWALSTLPSTTRTRYEKYGQALTVGEDLGTCKAGPCWIWDPLRFERDDEANTVTVQGVWFGSENENAYPCGETKKIPCSAGFHYCKLLSPARALEWMYVDGLRNKLSTKYT
mmetsp:Transcript_24346/g.35707  ORF Transcript_24346/g.35707 Transcript_24346/m.35707 type:complete len:589 (+) Transcript_24346:59-1825(+)